MILKIIWFTSAVFIGVPAFIYVCLKAGTIGYFQGKEYIRKRKEVRES